MMAKFMRVIMLSAVTVLWPLYAWSGAGVNDERRWPQSTIGYAVCDCTDNKVPTSFCTSSQCLKKPEVIIEAIKHWNLIAGSKIKLVPISASNSKEPYLLYVSQEDRGAITNDKDKTWCYTIPGFTGVNGPHPIVIGNRCTARKEKTLVRSVLHETGHAVGLYHEQQRTDRDNYLEFVFGGNTSNINRGQHLRICNAASPSNCQFQSITLPPFRYYDYGQDLGSYNPASVMHYALDDFEECKTKGAKDPQNMACMKLKPEGEELLQKMGLTKEQVGKLEIISEGDLEALSELYDDQ